MTFNEIWEEYIDNKRKRVKPSTVSTYSTLWESMRIDFGEKEISSITTKSVEKWAINLLSTMSRKSIKDRLVLLNNIIDFYGYEHEVNVCRINTKYIHWPTINASEGDLEAVKTFTPQEIRDILEKIAADPQPHNVLVAIMIGTGIRIGEACALTYGNINIESGTVEITGTVERIRVDTGLTDEHFDRMNTQVLHRASKSALILSTPKCLSSRRSVPVPGELLKVLRKFKSIYPANYYIATNTFKPSEPRTLRNHYYRLLESVGIEKRFSPHSLRHTYATTLITSGVDIKTTAALLGHGDAATTLEVYSHATVESKKKAMSSTVGKQFKLALSKKNLKNFPK